VLRTGKSLRVRGTFNPNLRYDQLDIVALDGSSFVATEDNPGRCPGPNWQLLARAGIRGQRGPVALHSKHRLAPTHSGHSIETSNRVVSIGTTPAPLGCDTFLVRHFVKRTSPML
jgi:hypothetical protein